MNELVQFFSEGLFNKVITSAGIGGAIVSLVATLVGFTVQRWSAHRKLQSAEEAMFSAALESDDLLTLGDYLNSTLGEFTIYEYTARPQVEKRVNRMLERVAEFVGETAEIKPVFSGESPAGLGRNQRDLPKQFLEVKAGLDSGESWNALARLRRIIEQHLREYGVSLGFKERHLRSAGQSLRLLADRNYVSEESFHLLDYAVRVCNEAVHGYSVPPGQAEEALSAAVQGLRLLKTKREGRGA